MPKFAMSYSQSSNIWDILQLKQIDNPHCHQIQWTLRKQAPSQQHYYLQHCQVSQCVYRGKDIVPCGLTDYDSEIFALVLCGISGTKRDSFLQL